VGRDITLSESPNAKGNLRQSQVKEACYAEFQLSHFAVIELSQ
jgi:hypothetical protein